ncbi:Pao retrotransposon peptidase [Nesidiocoris tenuis]|nr:Pao retrotransposon peptidase [Nesidiocoris tenuis]
MVESCLPMDVLKAWGRFRLAPHQDDVGSTKTPDKLLDALMKFIKAEVENEERMRLAANGFGLEQVVGSCNLSSRNVSLLSAATLLITDADTEKKIDLNKKVTVESEKIVQRTTPSPDQVKSAENIETKGDGLVFVETIFGWTVMGRYPQQLSPICIGNLNLELRERWELEDVENPEAPTNKLDNDRIENFEGTITCDEDVTRKKQKGKPTSTQSTDQINITAAFEITGVDLAGRLYRKDTWKIRWKFNPTTAAWWGGWWERIVRVVKELIRQNLPREINQEEKHRMIHPATKTRSGRVVHPHKQYRD